MILILMSPILILNSSYSNAICTVERDDSTKKVQQKLVQLAGSTKVCLAQKFFYSVNGNISTSNSFLSMIRPGFEGY